MKTVMITGQWLEQYRGKSRGADITHFVLGTALCHGYQIIMQHDRSNGERLRRNAKARNQ